MSELFTVKVRKVGTSLGVLIPKEVIEEIGITEGENVEVGLLKKRRLADVMKLFGTAKGMKPFERDKTDRGERW